MTGSTSAMRLKGFLREVPPRGSPGHPQELSLKFIPEVTLRRSLGAPSKQPQVILGDPQGVPCRDGVCI